MNSGCLSQIYVVRNLEQVLIVLSLRRVADGSNAKSLKHTVTLAELKMETRGAVGDREGQAGSNEKSLLVHTTGEAQVISREQLMKDLAKTILGAFGLRHFHAFDGERYHVYFSVGVEPLVEEGKYEYDDELLEEFLSHCRHTRNVSNKAGEKACPLPEEACPLPEVPPAASPVVALNSKERPRASAVEDSISASIPHSSNEVLYINEEYYLSDSSTPGGADNVGNQPVLEDQDGLLINPRTLKEIHFVMKDSDLSPEERRLWIYFPSLFSPSTPPNEADDHVPMEDPLCDGGLSNEQVNGGTVLQASTHSNFGKVKLAGRGKRKMEKAVEELEASQSVRIDKLWTVKSLKKKKGVQKKGIKGPPDGEPPWSGKNLGDLEEQIGDSWVEHEKLMRLLEDNPGDVVNPGQVKKSFWPTPLYGTPSRHVKVSRLSIEQDNAGPDVGTSEESSEVEDVKEPRGHSRKREEVALAKYALLFKDDLSWKKKFLDGFKLKCDICFSKRKTKIFSSVMSLLAHAQEARKLRQPEHRGYAHAIRNLLHIDELGNTPTCHSGVGRQSFQIETVWPPVVVLENTVIGLNFHGGLISLTTFELLHMLKALGDHGERKLHPVVKENGITGQVLVEFPTTYRGWIDAKHMHRYFELHARSYEDWLRLKPKFNDLLCEATEVQESNGLLAVLEDKVSVKRLLYGYLATPRLMKYVDPNKHYVNWEIEKIQDFFEISSSDCSQSNSHVNDDNILNFASQLDII